jgi:Protein of unknown function (DUF3159)
MSNPDHHEDKAKVLAAFGGKKGLIDSGIPSIIFLLVFNISDQLQTALISSVAISALLTIIRLAMRETIQHAVSGLIGSLICAWFANRTGNASDLYIPKLLTNLGYGSVYLIAFLGQFLAKTYSGEKIRPAHALIREQVGSGLECSLLVSQFSTQFIEVAM